MICRITFCIVIFTLSIAVHAQTMEEKVTVYLESFLSDNKSDISLSELSETSWSTFDPMGRSTISFDSNHKFRRKNDGFQASTSKVKGNWYINNEFVVLEVKKQKAPLYILKNGEELVLVDDDQIDVLKQLLTDASYKDGALKPYSYAEIFTFLNGFTIQNQ